MDVKSSWENVMGTPIARRTKDLYFKDKTLFVLLDSSVLREELMMGKTRIIVADLVASVSMDPRT